MSKHDRAYLCRYGANLKKGDKLKKSNMDILGNEWSLAPGGWEKVNQCQVKLFESHLELKSLGALIYRLENAELSGDDLQGAGLILQRISKRIFKLSEILSRATHKNNGDS